MHWKIRRDRYLSKLAEQRGEEAVWQAGFFFDEDPEDAPLDDVDWLTTPPPRRARSGKRPAVLLSTGGFCPPHAGHLLMMEHAKAAAEGAGWDVLGGYLSPGHDDYLRLKAGPAAVPASVRLRQCAEAAANTDWLSVDPWEALHRRHSVNYTDVAARLRTYLRAHVHPAIEVLYVCGGDNARFGLAFADDGGCVIVSRPGSEAEVATWRAKLGAHPNILWADGASTAASRAIRAPLWVDEPRKRLVLRTEGRHEDFERALTSLLAEHASVRTVGLDDPRDEGAVISMDAMLPAHHVLAVSRLFALGGYQPLGHVARPGAPPLADQIAAIPSGSYVLRDDDRVTGSTLAAVRAMLPDRIRITATRLTIEHDDDEDVADARDFLLDAEQGGLVIELPDGSTGRAPYVLPYVDPAVRCCVPPDRARALSKDVWALNERIFRGTTLAVRDLPAPTRRTFAFLGEGMPLDEVCRWHLRRLI